MWTPDRRPADAALARMQRICLGCPVRAECAFDASTSGAQCGVYAGVWVPGAQHRTKWIAAHRRLRQIGAGAVGVPSGVGVPA